MKIRTAAGRQLPLPLIFFFHKNEKPKPYETVKMHIAKACNNMESGIFTPCKKAG
jgi:hypothetical protein